MATITTTSFATPLRYPSQAYIDRGANGNLYFLKKFGATDFGVFVSTNNGISWSDVGINITRANLQEVSNIFVDAENTIHVCYRVYESGQDRIYYRNRKEGAAWSTELLVDFITVAAAGNYFSGMDLCAFKMNNQYFVFIAAGTRQGTSTGVSAFALTRVGVPDYKNGYSLLQGTRIWLGGPDGRNTPSIAFKHTGDGKTPKSNPAIWITWGRGDKAYCVKLSSQWSTGPSWYGPWVPTTVATGLVGQDYSVGRYDGLRDKFYISLISGNTVAVVERNVDDTGASARFTPSHPAGVVRHQTHSIDTVNGNFRVYAVGTSNDDLYFVDYTRATGSFGSWTLVTSTDVLTVNNFGVRRTNHGNGVYDLVLAHAGAPNTIVHTGGVLASPPKSPTISTPINGNPYDVNATLPVSWIFKDDDPADVQSAYVLRRQIGAGAFEYWNVGSATWGATEVWNASGSTSVNLASGWGADSDATHSYAVRVRDSTALDSDYGPVTLVIPSAKDNPTITSPVAAAVIATGRIGVIWTVATQTARFVELKLNGVRVHFSGWGNSTDTFYNFPTDLIDGGSYSIEVTTRNDEGLTSTTAVVNFTVDFIEPPLPFRVWVTPSPTNGYISVMVDNRPPTGGQPALARQDLYRRVVGDTSNGIRVAANLGEEAVYDDFTAAAETNYEYRFLLYGVNGTSVYTSWTA